MWFWGFGGFGVLVFLVWFGVGFFENSLSLCLT